MTHLFSAKPKVRLSLNANYKYVKQVVDNNELHTICESGLCPNKSECWGRGTATFLIMGDVCTRSCKFCNVLTGKPHPLDGDEPSRIAESVKLMKLKHCVITSVDRDDIEDGGSAHWAATIESIKKTSPATTIETLIPDFKGDVEALDRIVHAAPEVVSHNIETVERLSREVRVQAKYSRSIEVLNYLAERGMRTKSGIMLGLGETSAEVEQAIDDLIRVDCKIITIGQYLQPSSEHVVVSKFYNSEEFEYYRQMALNKGFECVESSNLVRSSYHAEKHV